jgi:hypothetical protein
MGEWPRSVQDDMGEWPHSVQDAMEERVLAASVGGMSTYFPSHECR